MTSSEWDTSTDVNAMLRTVADANRDTARLSRLFGCACGRLAWHLLSDDLGRPSIELVERYIDRKVGWDDLRREFRRIRRESPPESPVERAVYNTAVELLMMFSLGAYRAGRVAEHVREASMQVDRVDLSAAQSDLARDIFGDPVHRELFDAEWVTSTVIDLIRGIYDDRAFHRMPILGDALEEAGCTSARILDHCRGPKPHARGCWVLDGLFSWSASR